MAIGHNFFKVSQFCTFNNEFKKIFKIEHFREIENMFGNFKSSFKLKNNLRV